MHVVVLTPIAIDVVTLEAYENEIRKKQIHRKHPYYVDIKEGNYDECLKFCKENNLEKYMNVM